MSTTLDGKVALITGGNSGLGLATARYFVDAGATVLIAGRRQAELERAREALGERAIALQCDITRRDDLDRLFASIEESVPQLDIVVANAGRAFPEALGEYTEESLDAGFALNLKGTAFTVQGALPLMPDGGSIVLVSSIEGERGSPTLGAYAAAKAAQQSFARTWANELRDRRIRLNAISPGVVFTPAYTALGLTVTDMDPVIPSIPAGRLGDPEEIAAAIAFLASDASSFVNGTNLVTDGGQTEVV